MNAFDPRLTAARPDIAAAHLRGTVDAKAFVTPRLLRVTAPTAPLRREPVPDAPLDTEALAGEPVAVYEEREGWVWGQLLRDGYVGYLPAEALGRPSLPPDHAVTVPRTFVFPGPSIKLPPLRALPYAAEIAVAATGPAPFARLADGGFVFARHIAPLRAWRDRDFVATAERFLGVPYLWGGKTVLGIDCSGLVQVSLRAAGVNWPRDTYRQEQSPAAAPVAGGEQGHGLARGDLVYWKGHVGIMVDAERLLHANAHHMMVVTEPLIDVVERSLSRGGWPITSVKRLAFPKTAGV
ncbi:C40 family peptidase [Chelatococcus asaccharovorans]|uniref:C40 family peptidase n=1 Tax=Chelatococcus asaccharovorans TaxID=28210 RepID=UPI00224C7359|nr:C40 family peptidase [Chelatococcus asaccharovorans]CAH1650501.1 NLP/P60 family lipoprotein [Chelatococcus asaccharovorans]CAH1686755.1 NLP/P60 family lipoprotein [Chelatococcus asaccharovorans]